MVNGKISGLAGVGTRMVVADPTGQLSAIYNTVVNSRAQISGTSSSSYCKIGYFTPGTWNNSATRIKISKGSYDNCLSECNMLVSYSARGAINSTRVKWNGTFTNDSIRVFLNNGKIEIYAIKNTGFADVFFNIEYSDAIPFTLGAIADITLPSTGEITLTATADDKGV